MRFYNWPEQSRSGFNPITWQRSGLRNGRKIKKQNTADVSSKNDLRPNNAYLGREAQLWIELGFILSTEYDFDLDKYHYCKFKLWNLYNRH